ncbi:MAG: FecR domain-containing protein [Saprospiraceae bacterium]|nr:FecR domain-containing protein [Anaerolineales bacterium]NUN99215.1 FecR domain-containing protein [Saprospiraceae bacterium]
MAAQEELLQKYLEMLEAGASPADVMEQARREEPQLGPALTLAVAMRQVPPPPVDPVAARRQDASIQDFIRTRTRPSQPPTWFGKMTQWWSQAMPKPLAGAGLALVAVAIAAWALFSMNPTGTLAPEQNLTVVQLNGQAEAGTEANQWSRLQVGDELVVGQRLRTGSHSSVMLRFPDGSLMTLAHDTELIINTLTRQDKDTWAVELTQISGNTKHTVTPRENPKASYVVHTPASDAYVLGTTFSVAVAANGDAVISVDEGRVNVVARDKQVALTAGFATITKTGQTPENPVYAFSSHGRLLKAKGLYWEVDDLTIFVSDETLLDQDLKKGDYVMVSGRILPNGRWLADTIELVENINQQVTFTGVLNASTRDLWLVDEISVLVTADTQRSGDVKQGDLVRVTYTNLSGERRLALRIDQLEVPPALSENPGLIATPAIPLLFDLSFDPEEMGAAGCVATFNLKSALANNGETAAENLEIGFTVVTGDQYVESVSVTPSTWSEIPAGEAALFNVNVNLSTDWLSISRGSEVKIQLAVVSAVNPPQPSIVREVITLTQTCTPSGLTPTITAPPPLSAGTQASGSASSPSQAVEANCAGPASNPEGLRLANLYNVDYAEIITWFCRGFGFGEIDLAYNLSRQAGVDVASIFAMRQNGAGWGNIMQALGLLPNGSPDSSGGSQNGTDQNNADSENEDDGPPPWLPWPPGRSPGNTRSP